MESLTFKIIGGFVTPDFPRYQKISAFHKRDDVIMSILKREKMDSLDRLLLGTAVTNLTRMDFPREYGPLTLDRMILNPGGAYPLAHVYLVVGAVTCSGKLSLVLEYSEKNVDTRTMGKIKDKAMEFLLNE
jgi:hypothetical protein